MIVLRKSGPLIKDGSLKRSYMDTTTSGNSMITRIVAGLGVSITETGTDTGTGEVTIGFTGVLPSSLLFLDSEVNLKNIPLVIDISGNVNLPYYDDESNSDTITSVNHELTFYLESSAQSNITLLA